MNKILFLTIFSLILIGCGENTPSSPPEKINQEIGNIPSELIDSLSVISVNNQIFKIDNSKANTIVGEKGTILLFPANSLVDINGNRVKSEITIQLKECFSMQDYITSNLQTVHNSDILETKGMIYFSAKDENNNELMIANNNSIRMQIPQKDIENNPNIFIGNRANDGTINWSQEVEPSKTLTPYPIKFISKNRFWTECSNYYGITKDTINDKYYNHFGNIEDFENTLLATREFNIRFHSACWRELVKIYINNLDKNLWEIDELVIQQLIKDSLEDIEYYNENPPPLNNGKPATKEQWEAHNNLIKSSQESYHYTIKWFRKLASQKLTKVDQTKKIDTALIKDLNSALISYDATKFGWVNVDFFYKDPKAVEIKLMAKTNYIAPLINLIFKDRNIILSGIEQSSNEYWFTKNKDGYNKLPKGEKATIIAIGIKDSKLIFGEKEISIGENEVELIEMNIVSSKELKNKLEKYGS